MSETVFVGAMIISLVGDESIFKRWFMLALYFFAMYFGGYLK